MLEGISSLLGNDHHEDVARVIGDQAVVEKQRVASLTPTRHAVNLAALGGGARGRCRVDHLPGRVRRHTNALDTRLRIKRTAGVRVRMRKVELSVV